jgi:tetratricopeptide (TPR) repeat protein
LNETLTPQELAKRGKQSFAAGEYQEAAKAFQAAAQGYLHADEKLAAAEMQNNRGVSLLNAEDAQAALEAVQGTAEIFAAGQDLRNQAMAYGNEAAALEALDQIEEAEGKYQLSADLLGEIGEDDLKASVMRSLSELQLRAGRHLEAVASMHAGLDNLKRPKPKQRLVKKILEMPFKFLNRSE